MTNADKIRSMTDEELAAWFENLIWPECLACPTDCEPWSCKCCEQNLLAWLREEVDK